MNLLALETSCDETAAAVLRDGTEVVSNIVSSQVAMHAPHGGVVPDLAARAHLAAVGPVVHAALAPVTGGLDGVDAIAVTRGPGLAGCLIVGTSVAQGIAIERRLPIVAVSHIAGHVWSAWLAEPDVEPPLVALVASGGHTECIAVDADWRMRRVADTRDDAAGEAFDKVARLLGLPYPGGPAIERVAATGDASRFPLPRTRLPGAFSFSGLKTAVRYTVRDLGPHRLSATGTPESSQDVADLAASFQAVAVDQLVHGLAAAARVEGVNTVAVVGGVAANSALRAAVLERLGQIRVVVPPRGLCTDNAAMIAAAGWHRLHSHGPDAVGFGIDPALRVAG